MTASLGLALFFSGQARALDVYAIGCLFDPATGEVTIMTAAKSEGAEFDFVVGDNCLNAISVLKEADWGHEGVLGVLSIGFGPAGLDLKLTGDLWDRLAVRCPSG